MSKSVHPPENVEGELLETLKRRYPELESNEGVFQQISYDSDSSPQAKYSARVNYHLGQSVSTALFEYREDREKRSYYWYCRHDWRD
ncbi:hypothetical protein [Marinobacter xestospongiae]|uniref:Uncharacterized protein n=1 Tax=Marinobacter xestospongiae TaxID=994319 RepID=A0ABU3VU49_9GAMM|nr:hypothetical protein [Marinobacter xestospongiae]MDV2077793.1 hypothetical protein [Marinobacter xestospongiae]